VSEGEGVSWGGLLACRERIKACRTFRTPNSGVKTSSARELGAAMTFFVVLIFKGVMVRLTYQLSQHLV
jgi:hypothetical protein